MDPAPPSTNVMSEVMDMRLQRPAVYIELVVRTRPFVWNAVLLDPGDTYCGGDQKILLSQRRLMSGCLNVCFRSNVMV